MAERSKALRSSWGTLGHVRGGRREERGEEEKKGEKRVKGGKNVEEKSNSHFVPIYI